MGYKYTGDAILGASLTVNVPKPLDSRTVVDNLHLLYDIPAASAYQGMTVANIANGNIYMLVDKSKINEKAGWKASYESIQIITCTEAEYKLWQENTNEDFTPKDETQTYLHSDTYYYIFEDSLTPETEGLLYLTRSWGEDIEETLNSKASNDSIIKLNLEVSGINSNLENNYLTNDYIIETFATKALLEETFSTELQKYYTKEETDSIFVTKDALRGGIEGSDDFIFVTLSKYTEDQAAILELLDNTIKTNGEGLLESITVKTIKSPDETPLVVTLKEEGIFVNDSILAKKLEIPKIVTLSQSDYNSKVEEGLLDADTYYYIYDTNEDLAYITNEYLKNNYHTISLYQAKVAENYYQKKEIDEFLKNVQALGDYVTLEQIEKYYTSELADSKFLTIEYSNSNYALQLDLNTLSTDVKNNYVTKEMLKGPESDSTDYIFVTQTEYSRDKESNYNEFKSKHLISNVSSVTELNILKIENNEVELLEEIVSNVSLTTDNNNLLANGKKVATNDEVPNIVTLAQTEYNTLVENNEINKDTYYCTYSDALEDSVITLKKLDEGYYNKNHINANYYSKKEVSDIIKQLETTLENKFISEISKLTERINALELVSGILDLGKLDLITLK